MTNLAAKDNVVRFRPREAKVMSDQPQLSDGYFKVVNALADALATARVSQHQHQVIWAVLRKTYGWGKAKDQISDSQLAEVTGLTRQQCNTAKVRLLEQRILIREGGSFGQLKINTKTAEWAIQDKPQKQSMSRLNDNETLSRKTGHKKSRKTGHTIEQKDSIKPSYEGSSSGDDSAAAQIDLDQGDKSGRVNPQEPAKPKVPKREIPATPHQAILDAYHEILPELPAVKIFSDKRRSALRARWIQSARFQTVEFWRDMFQYIRTVDFLMGRKDPSMGRRVFMADFDFITSPSGFVKIVEGKYEN